MGDQWPTKICRPLKQLGCPGVVPGKLHMFIRSALAYEDTSWLESSARFEMMLGKGRQPSGFCKLASFLPANVCALQQLGFGDQRGCNGRDVGLAGVQVSRPLNHIGH